MPSPPRVALILLERSLPSFDGEAVVGDLTEEFVNRVDAGHRFAGLWFWMQALLFVCFGGLSVVRPADRKRSRLMTRVFSLGPALRLFRQDPGYAFAFIVTLGLGIGATTAIFSTVEGVLIRPLPYPHADRIVYVEDRTNGRHGRSQFSFVDIADYRAQASTIDEFVEYGDWQFTMVGAGDPQVVSGGLVSANYFKVLAIRPHLGRTLAPEDNLRQAPPVAVLTYEFWRTAFGANAAVVGTTIELSGIPTTIVGVLEPGSHYAGVRRAQLYANYTTNTHYMSASMQQQRTHRMTDVYALVKPGVALDAARADIRGVASRLRLAYPAAYPAKYAVTLTPWRDVLVQNARPTLLTLMGAVALVLLVACANVGNLTLARLIRREREFAVRAALGASGAALRAQLLSEHLVLALAGSLLGIGVAAAALRMLVEYTARLTLRADAVNLNGWVLAFSLGVGAAAAAVFAWVPRLPGTEHAGALSGSTAGRTTLTRRQRRTQRALVAVQVAVSFVVLVGAGLLLRTFENLQDVAPGFDATQVLSFQAPMDLPLGSTPAQARAATEKNRAVFTDLLTRLRGYPGVVSVATSSRAPFDTGQIYASYVKAEGSPLDGKARPLQMLPLTVSADYFTTLKIALVRGRRFGPDDRADTTPVAIVNEAMAKAAFGDENPLGRHIESSEMELDGPGSQPRDIVGVVHDIHEIGGAGGVLPTIYVPSTQADPGPAVLIRTTGDPTAVGRDAAQLIHAMDPRRPITGLRTLETAAAETIAPSRLNAALFGMFALLALSISAVGIGAVLAFSVTQRTREFGIRMALGSRRAQILGGVLREGLSIAGIGLALGALASVWLAGLLQRLLFDVAAVDPLTFIGVGALLMAVAGVAAWIPARRATQVDPSEALRSV